MEIEWDERKRLANIAKRRLDFEDAVLVLDSDKVLRLLARPAGEEARHRAIGYVTRNSGRGDLHGTRHSDPRHLDAEGKGR